MIRNMAEDTPDATRRCNAMRFVDVVVWLTMVLAVLSTSIPGHLVLYYKEKMAIQYSSAVTRVNWIRGATVEPTHLRLCRALTQEGGSYPKVVFEEESVCRDVDSPYKSLLQMFASSLIAKVARVAGMNTTYIHNCPIYGNDTIQGSMPDTLQIPGLEVEKMKSICSDCLSRFRRDMTASPECIFFSDQDVQKSSQHPTEIMERFLPHIQENVQQAVLSWSRTNPGIISGSFYPVPADQESPEHLSTSAVIYLTCHTDTCQGEARQLPHYKHIIAQEIPRSVKIIEIIASSPFVKHNENYSSLSDDLQNWLHQFYPHALIYYYTEKNTAESYARMLSATYIACRPGQACLIPVLTTRNYASYMGPPPSWLRHPPKQITFFAYSDFQKSYCKNVRGRFGRWIKDMDLSSKLQHPVPQNNPKSKQQKLISPSTTYKWEETTFSNCDINVFTKSQVCTLFFDLNINTIFMVGDEHAVDQAYSLLRILGQNPLPSTLQKSTWNFKFQCGFYHSMELIFVRNDMDTPTKAKCGHFCYLYSGDYITSNEDDQGKTVVIASPGDHEDTLDTFKKKLHSFLEVVDTAGKPDDFFYYRTLSPGHTDCQNLNKPFATYRQYLNYARFKEDTEWKLFPTLNDYTDRVFEERRRSTKKKVQFLDVYTMTALRPDGHLGAGECKGKECPQRDCSRYESPGVVDWWNHLLFSNLNDAMESTQPQEPSRHGRGLAVVDWWNQLFSNSYGTENA